MSTWLNRGASGGLAGARKMKKNQPTANSQPSLTHRISETPVLDLELCHHVSHPPFVGTIGREVAF